MTHVVTANDVEQFRVIISRRLGLQFDDSKLGMLGDVLQQRVDAVGGSCVRYLYLLTEDTTGHEVAELASGLTVPETYFFRNNEQFQALTEHVVPARMLARRESRTLRVLSAGCASGEEPYSIAIALRDAAHEPGWDVSIRAVDINPVVLEKARLARYSPWALRTTPPPVQQQWFRADGRDVLLDDRVRAAVTFEPRNLSATDPGLWIPDFYDVIFFRNVLMYFTPEHMRAAVARAARSLAPGGFLFLGHAETLRGCSDEFHLRHTNETFYYQRKDRAEGAIGRRMHTPPEPASSSFPVAESTDGWTDVIRSSGDRIAAIVPPLASGARPARHRPTPWDVTAVLDLLAKERFADALACVRELPPASDGDPAILLLEATLLMHGGQGAEADAVCRRLLRIDEMNAGAHYVLALCGENVGNRQQAVEENRIAAYLDPTFAMPRLHLGLLARRAGDLDAARREFGQARPLLEREDSSRLLFFGGGFTRASLLSLCESALRDCGGIA